MSNYRVQDPEEEVECPYEKSHMVRAKRLPYHLQKCRKNYAGNDYAVCPFNARHEMPRPEYKYHIKNCADKAMIEKDFAFDARKYNDAETGTFYKGNTEIPAHDIEWDRPDPTEDWDADAASMPRVVAYPKIYNDPQKFRDLSDLKPSEKKEYRKRLLQISERQNKGLPYDDLLEDMTGREKKRQEQQQQPGKMEPERQLRLPKEKPRVLQQQEMLKNSLMSAGIGRGRPCPPPGVKETKNTDQEKPMNMMNGVDHGSMNGVKKVNQDGMLLAQLARGRGITIGTGRGRGQMLAPGAVGRGINGFMDDEDRTKRETRKIEKKLREIDALFQKQQDGLALNPDQLGKISKREELLKDLAELKSQS